MYKRFFKRVLDFTLSLFVLPFVLIEILILGPIVFLTDRGPVFYNAERIGVNGRRFKMFKLRSMYVNAPDLRNADGSTFNSDNDPRVTPIGRLLRKTSLDEFPQFLNVFLGDMSFVGPRPVISTKSYEEYDDILKKRLSVRPGVTGYSQAYFRNSITQKEKYKYDCYYVDNMSLVMEKTRSNSLSLYRCVSLCTSIRFILKSIKELMSLTSNISFMLKLVCHGLVP